MTLQGKTQLAIPSLVRIKSSTLDRLGVYLARFCHLRICLIMGRGSTRPWTSRMRCGFGEQGVEVLRQFQVHTGTIEETTEVFGDLPPRCQAVVGVGGGRVIDVAKYVAFLAGLPFYAVPTALSNDGFASPQSSLTVGSRRKSMPSAAPFAVVIDTAVCLEAPELLWLSGVGDLVAKVTATYDWHLASQKAGVPFHDLAAHMSDATVFQFMAAPGRNIASVHLLANALLLNGITMQISGSSRPASGSEHLISHALDAIAEKPAQHGLQVGIAAYLVSKLQGQGTERIIEVFHKTGFWRGVEQNPFRKSEWLEAARLAPTIKSDYYTVLSERDCLPEIEAIIDSDPLLQPCFCK